MLIIIIDRKETPKRAKKTGISGGEKWGLLLAVAKCVRVHIQKCNKTGNKCPTWIPPFPVEKIFQSPPAFWLSQLL